MALVEPHESSATESRYFLDLGGFPEGASIKSKHFSTDWLQLHPEGGFLILDMRQRLMQFDDNGVYYGEIRMEQGGIVCFAYLRGEEKFVTIAGVREIDEVAYKIFLYDRELQPIGTAEYHGNGKLVVPNFTRQILPIEDSRASPGNRFRIFINRWQPGFENLHFPKMLQEVKLKQVGPREWVFLDKGEPFDMQMEESAAFASQFKQRWVVRDPESDLLLTMDQLRPVVEGYRPGRNGFKREAAVPVHLERWVPRGSFFYENSERAWFEKQRKDGKDLDRNAYYRFWDASFSKVTGLYPYGTGYLVSYQRPNDISNGAISPDAGPHLLCLQRLDRDRKPIGPSIERPGAFMFGVADDVAYLFHPSGSEKEPHRVEAVFGYHFPEKVKNL